MFQFLRLLFTPSYKVHVSLEIADDVWMHRTFTLPFVPFHNLVIEDAKGGDSVIYDEVRISDEASITWNVYKHQFECFGEWGGPLSKGPKFPASQIIIELKERGWTSDEAIY